MNPPPLVVYAAPTAGVRAAFTIKETAELLGVSRSTVSKMIQDGDLSATHVTKQIVRIPARSIEELLAPERRAANGQMT